VNVYELLFVKSSCH